MERIELYDKYINDRLSPKERNEFDARLKTDKEFLSDFKVYLFTIDGICREASQDNFDFGMAMKGLSKEQLKEIIGKRQSPKQNPKKFPTSKPKVISFKPWIWQAASIAAIVIIAFTAIFNIQKQSGHAVDNAIIALADYDLSRGASIEIDNLTDEELMDKLPDIEKIYQSSKNVDEVANNGYVLAMTYLRLHQRDNAIDILTQMIDECNSYEYYEEKIIDWEKIIEILKNE